MTLIAAFRCDSGVVICADSQETVTLPDGREYRVRVTKITPQDAGDYEIVIGGAGASGPLIDRFTRDLVDAIRQWPTGLASEEIETGLSGLLERFHLTHVVASTYQSSDFDFLVCIKGKADEEIGLWTLRDTAVLPVETYTMIGWEEAQYDREVSWLYPAPGKPWIAQGVLLGVRLFVMAKDTSNYVGGPTQVIVVRDNGMHVEDPRDVQVLEERVETFNRALAGLVLACPDTSIHRDGFRELLGAFEDTVMNLREHYFQTGVAASLARALNDPNHKGDPYPKFPVGTLDKSGRTATKYKAIDESTWDTSQSVSPSPSPSPSPEIPEDGED